MNRSVTFKAIVFCMLFAGQQAYAVIVGGPYGDENDIFQGYAPGLGNVVAEAGESDVSVSFKFTATEDNVIFHGAGTIINFSNFDNFDIATQPNTGIAVDASDDPDIATFQFGSPWLQLNSGQMVTLTFSWDSAAIGDPAVIGDTQVLFSILGGGPQIVTPVPVPAAAWLFGSALLGLVSLKRKKA